MEKVSIIQEEVQLILKEIYKDINGLSYRQLGGRSKNDYPLEVQREIIEGCERIHKNLQKLIKFEFTEEDLETHAMKRVVRILDKAYGEVRDELKTVS